MICLRRGRHLLAVLLVFLCMQASGLRPANALGSGTLEVFEPAERGAVVVVLSGVGGIRNYRFDAGELAKLGYYVVPVDGKEILWQGKDGRGTLRSVIADAQSAPKAIPGKAAVVGYSLGGGGAIFHAASQPDIVSTVVAYYPNLTELRNHTFLANRIDVPVLVLAGGRDTYLNCCLVESMRSFQEAAMRLKAPVELVIYPEADHAFNLHVTGPSTYRHRDAQDAWQRMTNALLKSSGTPAKP